MSSVRTDLTSVIDSALRTSAAKQRNRLAIRVLLSAQVAFPLVCALSGASALADDLPAFSVTSFTASAALSGVTAGDFNNDGLADFVVLYRAPNDSKVTVYFSNPASPGTFLAPVDIPASGVLSAHALDINHDGRIDLALIIGGSIWTCFGNPPGSPTPFQDLVKCGDISIFLNFGDFNHDGWPDILASNGNGDMEISLNGGPASPGKFPAVSFGIDTSFGVPGPQAAVGDFNADGWPDLALADQASNNYFLRTYINNHNGTFTPLETFNSFPPSSDAGRLLVTADFNGDGRSDFAFTTYSSGSFLGVFLARTAPAPADGRMMKYSNKGGPANAISLRVADFNLDGWPDFLESATSAPNEQTLVVLLNSPPPFNGYSFRPMHLGGLTAINMSDFGDFNGDGKPDIVAVSTGGSVSVPSAITILLNTTVSPSTPCPADLNGDALVDDSDFVIFLAAYNQLLCE